MKNLYLTFFFLLIGCRNSAIYQLNSDEANLNENTSEINSEIISSSSEDDAKVIVSELEGNAAIKLEKKYDGVLWVKVSKANSDINLDQDYLYHFYLSEKLIANVNEAIIADEIVQKNVTFIGSFSFNEVFELKNTPNDKKLVLYVSAQKKSQKEVFYPPFSFQSFKTTSPSLVVSESNANKNGLLIENLKKAPLFPSKEGRVWADGPTPFEVPSMTESKIILKWPLAVVESDESSFRYSLMVQYPENENTNASSRLSLTSTTSKVIADKVIDLSNAEITELEAGQRLDLQLSVFNRDDVATNYNLHVLT